MREERNRPEKNNMAFENRNPLLASLERRMRNMIMASLVIWVYPAIVFAKIWSRREEVPIELNGPIGFKLAVAIGLLLLLEVLLLTLYFNLRKKVRALQLLNNPTDNQYQKQ